VSEPVSPNSQMEIARLIQRARDKDRHNATVFVLTAAVILISFAYAGFFAWERYRDALGVGGTLLTNSLPPDFSRWRSWLQPFGETVAMSIAGTVLGAGLAAPLALAASSSIAPARLVARPARVILNMMRSIPDIVLGVIFVAAVGFGPLPGVLALGFHSAGMLGKFYAEIIEHEDAAPADALRAHGASEAQVLRFATLPQIWPRILDVTLYRWEHNLRAATVMGLVGAGGIGLELISALRLFEYREALALILITLALVTVLDAAGAWLRRYYLRED
jgi:phosphonate transport system permease protein